MMPAKRKYKKTNFKCPKCGGDCFFDKVNFVYSCNRPMILNDGTTGGSCGKFTRLKEEIDLWKR